MQDVVSISPNFIRSFYTGFVPLSLGFVHHRFPATFLQGPNQHRGGAIKQSILLVILEVCIYTVNRTIFDLGPHYARVLENP